jgi:hypothetical protein
VNSATISILPTMFALNAGKSAGIQYFQDGQAAYLMNLTTVEK